VGQTIIIDTVPVRIERDGEPVYVSEREAGLFALASGFLWVCEHPAQTLHGLAWTSVAAGSLYLLYDAMKPRRRRHLRWIR
jgi:hypothetical protein